MNSDNMHRLCAKEESKGKQTPPTGSTHTHTHLMRFPPFPQNASSYHALGSWDNNVPISPNALNTCTKALEYFIRHNSHSRHTFRTRPATFGAVCTFFNPFCTATHAHKCRRSRKVGLWLIPRSQRTAISEDGYNTTVWFKRSA